MRAPPPAARRGSPVACPLPRAPRPAPGLARRDRRGPVPRDAEALVESLPRWPDYRDSEAGPGPREGEIGSLARCSPPLSPLPLLRAPNGSAVGRGEGSGQRCRDRGGGGHALPGAVGAEPPCGPGARPTQLPNRGTPPSRAWPGRARGSAGPAPAPASGFASFSPALLLDPASPRRGTPEGRPHVRCSGSTQTTGSLPRVGTGFGWASG